MSCKYYRDYVDRAVGGTYYRLPHRSLCGFCDEPMSIHPIMFLDIAAAPIITDFRLLRHSMRDISTPTLSGLIEIGMPQLRFLRIERFHCDMEMWEDWYPGTGQQEGFEDWYFGMESQSRGYVKSRHRHIWTSMFPKGLREIYLFEEHSYNFYLMEPARCFAAYLSRELPHVEHVSCLGLANNHAMWFFADVPNSVAHGHHSSWPALKTLLLTEECLANNDLDSESDDDSASDIDHDDDDDNDDDDSSDYSDYSDNGIRGFLHRAAKTTTRMPKLEVMELWNFGHPSTYIWTYNKTQNYIRVRWHHSDNPAMGEIHRQRAEMWCRMLNAAQQTEVDMRIEVEAFVTSERVVPIEDVIAALELSKRAVAPRTLIQYRLESEELDWRRNQNE